MKALKRTLSVLLAALLLFSLAGCGSMSMRAANAAARLASQDGALLDISLDADVTLGLGGHSFNVSAKVAGPLEYTRDPSAGRLEFELGGMGLSGAAQAYWQKNDDGSRELYVSTDGGESWSHRTLEAKEKTSSLSVSDIFGALLTGMQSFTEVSRDEEVQGRSATCYDGTLDRELLRGLLAAAGYGSDAEDEDGRDIISMIGDLPVSIWLDNSDDRLLRVEIDLTEAFGTIFALAKDKLPAYLPAGTEFSIEAQSVVLDILVLEREDDGPIVMPSDAPEEESEQTEETEENAAPETEETAETSEAVEAQESSDKDKED